MARDPALAALRAREGGRPWTRGGCATFAAGLRHWLGPGAAVIGVRERGDHQIDHVAATWRGLYFDALGVRDESDFLFDMETRGLFRIPVLVPVVDPSAIRNVDFAPGLAAAVALALAARLDPRQALEALGRLAVG